jgi:hypothetical protein
MLITLFVLSLRVILGISRFVISRATSFLSDYFVILLYALIAWSIFPNQTLEIYTKSLFDTTELAFRIPIVVLVGYLLASYLIYVLWYQRVATYLRWMYAVRVLLLTLFPLITLGAMAKLAVTGRFHLLANDSGEGFGLFMAVLVIAFLGWVFASMTYIVSIFFSTDKDPDSHDLILWPKMVALLFRRKKI